MPIPSELKLLATRAGRCISSPKKIEIDAGAWEKKQEASKYFRRATPKEEDKYSRSIELQREIFEDLRDMNDAGIRITPIELCAIRALRVGLYSRSLLDNVNAIRSLMDSKVIVGPRSAAPTLAQPVRENKPIVINERLKNSPRALSSMELLRDVYDDPKDYEWSQFNLVLQLLETMGHITKLPNDSSSVSNSHMWVHNKHSRWTDASMPSWNLSYAVLTALQRLGPMKHTDLSGCQEVVEIVRHVSQLGRGPGSVNLAHLRNPLDGLESESLIKIGRSFGKNRRAVKLYELTPFAIELLELTKENGYLVERLRIALLGQRINGLTRHEEDTLYDIIRCLDVLRERKCGNGSAVIAKRLHDNESYVHSVIHLGARPWGRMSRETIKRVYLPSIREHFPEYESLFIESLRMDQRPDAPSI